MESSWAVGLLSRDTGIRPRPLRHLEPSFLVSQGAHIKGDIYTKEAILGGEVVGVVQAEERVEVQATALVIGDIITKRIVVLEGGRVNGAVKMDGSGGGGGGSSSGSSSPTTYPSSSKPKGDSGN